MWTPAISLFARASTATIVRRGHGLALYGETGASVKEVARTVDVRSAKSFTISRAQASTTPLVWRFPRRVYQLRAVTRDGASGRRDPRGSSFMRRTGARAIW